MPRDRHPGGVGAALFAAVPEHPAAVRCVPLAGQRRAGRPGPDAAGSGVHVGAGAGRIREGRKHPPPVGPGHGGRRGQAESPAGQPAGGQLGPGAELRRCAERHHHPARPAADHSRLPLHRRGAHRRHGSRAAQGPGTHCRRHRDLPCQRAGPATLRHPARNPGRPGAESRNRGPAQRAPGRPASHGRRPGHAVEPDGLVADRRRHPAHPDHRIHLADLRPPEPGQGPRRTTAQGPGFDRDRGPVRRPVQTLQPGHHQRPGPGPGPRALRRATVALAGAA